MWNELRAWPPFLMDRCALQKSHLWLSGAQNVVCSGCLTMWDGTKHPEAKGHMFLQVVFCWGNPAESFVKKLCEAALLREAEMFLIHASLDWIYSLGFLSLSQLGWSPLCFPAVNARYRWTSFQTLSPLKDTLAVHIDCDSIYRPTRVCLVSSACILWLSV